MTSCRTHHSTYFMNYYPSIHLLYAFMSIISLHSILLWKSTKVWGLTEVGNSSAHLLILNYDSIQKCNKTLSSVVSVLPPSGWVSSSFLGVIIIFTYTEPWKVTAVHFETTCEAWWPILALFIQNRFTESLYNQRLGKGKKNCSFDTFFEKLPWTVFINHPRR